MSEHKKTFSEWWNGLQKESKLRQHLIRGVLPEQRSQHEPPTSGRAAAGQRDAGPAALNERLLVSLSREQRAWLLCHLIGEIGSMQVELADIQTRRLRHPHLATLDGLAAPGIAFKEAVLTENLRLAQRILQALNDAGVR